jgi:hypothetical protein
LLSDARNRGAGDGRFLFGGLCQKLDISGERVKERG